MRLKSTAIILAVTIILTHLGGCAGNGASETVASGTAAATAEAKAEETLTNTAVLGNTESSGEPTTEPVSISYPITRDNDGLSVWASFQSIITQFSGFTSYDEQYFFKEAQERIGVDLTFVDVSQQTEQEKFNLAIASGEYPDIFFGMFQNYSGGVSTAYSDNVIIDLKENDVEHRAPDYYNYIMSDPVRTKGSMTDDGHMLAFNGYGDASSIMLNGVMIRNDWLKELGLEKPQTFAEIEDILTAFKVNYNISTPYMLPPGSVPTSGWLISEFKTKGFETDARAVGGHLFRNGETVVSSLTDDNYLEYLKFMSGWYSQGLINKEYFMVQTNPIYGQVQGVILGDDCGIWGGNVANISEYTSGSSTEGFEIAALGNAKKDDSSDGINTFSGTYTTSTSAAFITTGCEDIELAMNWFNYFFTDEGALMANYGEEGLTYTIVNGEPQYTDLLINNEKMNYTTAARIYLFEGVPSKYHTERVMAAYTDEEQEALAIWNENRSTDNVLPSLTLTAEENEQISTKLTDIETYAAENITKFITGEKPFEDWTAFKAQVMTMGLQDVINVYQNAYNRYLAR